MCVDTVVLSATEVTILRDLDRFAVQDGRLHPQITYQTATEQVISR